MGALRTSLPCLAPSGNDPFDPSRFRQYANFAKNTSQPTATPSSSSSPSRQDYFDGNFQSDPFIDGNAILQMQNKLRESLSPEVRDSIQSMMQSALQGNVSGLGGKMGVMAFGLGENERGKKVARAAQMSYDMQTGEVNKDFVEQQLEPDDPSLPKETVEDYSTDGAMEVEFVDPDAAALPKEGGGEGVDAKEAIAEGEIEIESAQPDAAEGGHPQKS